MDRRLAQYATVEWLISTLYMDDSVHYVHVYMDDPVFYMDGSVHYNRIQLFCAITLANLLCFYCESVGHNGLTISRPHPQKNSSPCRELKLLLIPKSTLRCNWPTIVAGSSNTCIPTVCAWPQWEVSHLPQLLSFAGSMLDDLQIYWHELFYIKKLFPFHRLWCHSQTLRIWSYSHCPHRCSAIVTWLSYLNILLHPNLEP